MELNLSTVVKNIEAFLGGVTLIVGLFFLARVFGAELGTTSTEIGFTKQAIGAIFIGISSGYYLGKGSESSSWDRSLFFVMGILLPLIAGTLYYNRLSGISGVLIFFIVAIFLMYDSEIARGELDLWIEKLKTISWGGLVFIGLIEYGVPVFLIFSEWLAQLSQSSPLQFYLVIFFILVVVIAILAQGYRIYELYDIPLLNLVGPEKRFGGYDNNIKEGYEQIDRKIQRLNEKVRGLDNRIQDIEKRIR